MPASWLSETIFEAEEQFLSIVTIKISKFQHKKCQQKNKAR